MSIKLAIITFNKINNIGVFMANKTQLYPCELCNKLCVKKFYRAFCCTQCRLKGQTKIQNDCWLWQGRIKQDGYGVCILNGKEMRVHRASHLVFKGYIDENLLVLHSCNKPLCINPEHLRLGTAKENAQDTILSNNQRKGETVGNSKLTEQQVLEIRNIYKTTNLSQAKIAEMYKINQTNVGFIVRRVRWKHI